MLDERPAVLLAPRIPTTRRAVVSGLGAEVPATVVPNADVARRLGVDEEWIVRRTGIRERRYAGPDDTVVSLAVAAGRAALADAGVSAEELDLVLVATATADDVLPNAAPVVAHELGAVRAGAFDVGAACAGFVTALSVAAAWIETRRAEHVLVIGAEIFSRFLDHDDAVTAPLFGDGAGATVLSGRDGGGVHPGVVGADGSRAAALVIDRENRILRMDGHDTFGAAVTALTAATHDACARAEVPLESLDLIVFHQANVRILRAVAQRLGVSEDILVDDIARHGNTSAASVPLALVSARDAGRLRPGARVLLAGVGAGFTWAATVVEWTH